MVLKYIQKFKGYKIFNNCIIEEKKGGERAWRITLYIYIYHTHTGVAQSLCKHDRITMYTRVYTKPINTENIFTWFIVSSHAHAKIICIYVVYIIIIFSCPCCGIQDGTARFPAFPCPVEREDAAKHKRTALYIILYNCVIRRRHVLAVGANHNFSNFPVRLQSRSCFSTITIWLA